MSALPSDRFVVSSSIRFAIAAFTFSSLMDGTDASARVILLLLLLFEEEEEELFRLAKVRIAAVDTGAASFYIVGITVCKLREEGNKKSNGTTSKQQRFFC